MNYKAGVLDSVTIESDSFKLLYRRPGNRWREQASVYVKVRSKSATQHTIVLLYSEHKKGDLKVSPEEEYILEDDVTEEEVAPALLRHLQEYLANSRGYDHALIPLFLIVLQKGAK